MDFIWMGYEFIINLVEAYLMYLFLKVFFDDKHNNKSSIILIVFCQASIIQIANVIFGVASIPAFIIILSCYIFLYGFLFKGSISKLALGILSYSVLTCIFELLSVFIITNIFCVSPMLICEKTKYRIISAVLTRILLYLFIIFIRKFKISPNNLKRVYIYELTIILMLNIFFAFIVFNIYKKNNILKFSRPKISIVTLAVIVLSFLVVVIVQEIIKYSQKEAEWIMLEREYKRQISYINYIQNLNYRARAQRHDFNHHIGCIYGLLDTNKIEEAKDYTKKLVVAVEEINNIVNIDNPVIAAILNFKFTLAKKKKIGIESSINIPKELNIDSTDICIILGNAIDNAIEACEDLQDKRVNIEMHMVKEHLIIKITNTKKGSDHEEGHKYTTIKNDEENHGFGLENIKYVVSKYDGLFKINETDNLFSLNIALKNHSN